MGLHGVFQVCLALILWTEAVGLPVKRLNLASRSVAASHQPSSADLAAAAAAQAEAAAARRKDVQRLSNSSANTLVHNISLKLGHKDDWHPFEGVGALSAGASSRLLLDYPEEQRTEILDLLFKPKYGASLQVLKVEIGGDMQSTDGSEPSHMRFKGEKPDCSRGYETWLMKEAKARNPSIRTYALAWGVPGWIGNGNFFSQDNIVYHVSWLKCVRDTYGFDVDYIGVWNEMPWGQVWYVDELARAIAAENLKTKLVLLDAIHNVDQGFLDRFNANATFRSLVAAVGMHYPCTGNDGLMSALSQRKETRFWASEELSTVADWGGAGCWGRMINQNYIRMNATSSIAWSLVWSAYPNLECFGNGLLYAFEPWSGHFGVMPPVWTSAHTTQFTEVDWKYLAVGDGAGLLPEGGTYVTMVNEQLDDFTVVLETLQGQCFYKGGCFHDREATGPQKVRFHLGQMQVGSNGSSLATIAKNRGVLEVWMTNQSHLFQRLEDVKVDADNTVTLIVPVDAVVTLSTLAGASKAGERGFLEDETSALLKGSSTPDAFNGLPGKRDKPSMHFPLPYSESFDEYDHVRMPKFFADQGGAFEVVDDSASEVKHSDPSNGSQRLHNFHINKVLEQTVMRPPIAWIGHSPEPLTLFGDVNWTDIDAEVVARLGVPRNSTSPETNLEYFHIEPHSAQARHAGLCVRLSRYHFFGSGAPEGYCLRLMDSPPAWKFMAAGSELASGELSTEISSRLIGDGWVRLRLVAHGARLTAYIEDEKVMSVIDTMLPFGQVALECGYHRCQLDDLRLSPLSTAVTTATDGAGSFAVAASGSSATRHRSLVRRLDITQFIYTARTCDPAPRMTPRRRDFTGLVGFAFEPKRPLLLKGLGRLRVSGGHPWARVHNVSLFAGKKMVLIASAALSMDSTSQVGIEETDDGWVFAYLREPVQLSAGTVYLLASSELANGDTFYDKAVHVDIDDDIAVKGPVYKDNTGWHEFFDQPNQLYGPLNALLEEAPVTPLLPFGNTKDSQSIVSKQVPFGKPNFEVGQRVERRDDGKDWGTGYVTSVDPLKVTVADSPAADGYRWQHVRQIPMSEKSISKEDAKLAKASTPDVHSFRAALRHTPLTDSVVASLQPQKIAHSGVNTIGVSAFASAAWIILSTLSAI